MDVPNNGNGYVNGHSDSNGRLYDPAQPAAPGRNSTLTSAQIARIVRPVDEEAKRARFSILDYLRLIWRGKWIIGACFLVAALGTAYYTYSLPFVFQSSLNVMLKDKDEKVDLGLGGGYSGYQSPDRLIKKEISILRSRPILEKTADSLLRRRFLDPVAKDTVIPLIQQAEATVLRPRATPLADSVVRERMISMLSSSIGRVTSASPSKEADIITISCKTGDPREAALIANVYAWVYVKNSEEQARYSAQAVKKFLEDRMSVLKDTLDKQATDLQNYQEGTGAIAPQTQAQDLMAQRTQLSTQANEVQIELQTTSETFNAYRQQLAAVEPGLSAEVASATTPIINDLLRQIAAKDVELNMLLAQNPRRASEIWYQRDVIGPRRAELSKLRAKLAEQTTLHTTSKLGSLPMAQDGSSNPTEAVNKLRQQIFNENIKLQGLRARAAAVAAAQSKVEGELARIPEQMKEVQQLQDEMKGNVTVVDQMRTTYGIKVVEVESQFAKVQIMEEAQPNSAHVSPNRAASIITGALAGLILGIGIVLLIAHADTTVHSPDDLEKNGYTVLTAISPIDEAKLATLTAPGLVHKLGKVSPHLVSYADSKSPVAESYRSLRTAIQFASIEHQVRTILVTSSIPQEGKSTTSTNLAIVIAQSGGRTLLIDCDLRRPVLHSIFGMGKEPGLVNALVGGVPVEKAIRETGIPNLSILSSGTIPPNPSELLGSRRMRELLEQLKEQFDTIILDSPPVSAVTDAVILSTFTDVAITVVRAHKTKMEFLDKTREDITRVSNSLLGVVLNDFDASQSYGATYKYYRYYRYYSYYGQSEEEAQRKQRRAEAAVKNETV
jgi:capsular exopolysaccharide synthesis family protein